MPPNSMLTKSALIITNVYIHYRNFCREIPMRNSSCAVFQVFRLFLRKAIHSNQSFQAFELTGTLTAYCNIKQRASAFLHLSELMLTHSKTIFSLPFWECWFFSSLILFFLYMWNKYLNILINERVQQLYFNCVTHYSFTCMPFQTCILLFF